MRFSHHLLLITGTLFSCALLSCTPQPANTNGSGANMNAVVPYKVTLQGTYDCLPHMDTSGPQTLECALGMKAEDGTYYALDVSSIAPERTAKMQTGNTVVASGVMTPIEMLSSDQWQKYNVKGILKVGTLSE